MPKQNKESTRKREKVSGPQLTFSKETLGLNFLWFPFALFYKFKKQPIWDTSRILNDIDIIKDG